MKGEGRAIVCAVGENTFLARRRTKDSLIIEEERTLLEQKLEFLSEVCGKWCYIFCLIIGLSLLIYNTVHTLFGAGKSLFSNDFLVDTLRIAILTLCLLIVAIPEGMPLAISIAMAMSVDQMKNDNILIKNIEAVQVCALLHEICVGKTGTLTGGKMHVGAYQLVNEPTVHPNDWKDPIKKAWFNNQMRIAPRIPADANDTMKGLIREAILANTDVHLEVDEGDDKGTANYIAKGQTLEAAMIDFLMENGEDVYNGFNS
jgi:magnesium-transporting ATPase (P-type)